MYSTRGEFIYSKKRPEHVNVINVQLNFEPSMQTQY